MMRLGLLFICLAGLLLVACGTAQPAPTMAAVVQGQGRDTAVYPPTTTTLPAINTAVTTATTPLPTATPLPTNTPTATPIPLPPLTGRIYFFWDPTRINDLNTEPVYRLYSITPGETPDDWNIQALVEEIIGHPQVALSPGKTIFAFTILEDKNGDGSVSDEGYDRGFDAPNIFTYTLTDGEFARLTSEYFSGYLGWLSDDELAVGFRAINTEDLSWRQVITEEEIPDNITSIILSPDGKVIAINLESGQISLAETESGKVLALANEIGGSNTEMIWSVGGQWLALNQLSTSTLILVNIQTLETVTVDLSNSIRNPVWSPNNKYIAAIQETPDGTMLFFLNVLDLSYYVKRNTSGQIHSLSWSPDSSKLAMAINQEGEVVSLDVLDIQSGDLWELWEGTESVRFRILAWSPNSEWLLFFNGQSWSLSDDRAGIYVIHQNGGVPYLVLETSSSRDPKAFYWLSEINMP